MYNRFFKRLLDIIGSLIALPFFILLYIPVAILIKLEDKGPVFYNAERLGKNNKLFRMYKFRSMKVNAPDLRLADGSTYNGADDPRVTKIGKFLRETSIDEIPQILNILLGDMSFIGPRPDVKSDAIVPEGYNAVLQTKPGLTGYSQAYFRNETNRLEKIRNDEYYAIHVSFLFDLKIALKTIVVVLKRDKMYRQ